MGKEKSCQCEANLKEALEIREKKGRSSTKKLAEDYAEYTCEFIRKETGEEKPLKDFKIVIDAGNGAAGFFADKVIKELGGNPEGSQFLNPDGDFPNHVPNPEAKEAIEKCSNAGILTIMITGDHVLTATAIAKELRNIKKWKNCYGRYRT